MAYPHPMDDKTGFEATDEEIEQMFSRERIAEIFLYETGMFNSLGDIRRNLDHNLVKAAFRAADRINAMNATIGGTPGTWEQDWSSDAKIAKD